MRGRRTALLRSLQLHPASPRHPGPNESLFPLALGPLPLLLESLPLPTTTSKSYLSLKPCSAFTSASPPSLP